MQRIPTIIQKIAALAKQDDKNTVIDIDLMLDYTRVLYADLLEWKGKLIFTESLVDNTTKPEMKSPAQQQDVVSHSNKESETEQNEEPVRPQTIFVEEKNVTTQKSDIRQSIGINDKYQYISELFGNNKEAYEDAMQQMNTCSSFQQALKWLDEHVYKQYYWNEDSEAVQSFYNLLGAFFAER